MVFHNVTQTNIGYFRAGMGNHVPLEGQDYEGFLSQRNQLVEALALTTNCRQTVEAAV